MNLFYVEIDKDGHILNMTQQDKTFVPHWYLVAINDDHLSDFQINYRHYKYNPKEDDTAYPSDDNTENMIHPSIPGQITSLAFSNQSMSSELSSVSASASVTDNVNFNQLADAYETDHNRLFKCETLISQLENRIKQMQSDSH